MGKTKIDKSKEQEAEIRATEGKETAVETIESGASVGLLDEGVG